MKALLSAICLALVVLPASSATATFPGTNGKIVFSSNAGGDYEIYSVNADGSGLNQLTNNSVDDLEPAWSPDGRFIVFVSNRVPDNHDELHVIEQNGSSDVVVSPPEGNPNSAFISDPEWSPDARTLLYAYFRPTHGWWFIVTLQQGGLPINVASFGVDPTWSPDGTEVAFRDDFRTGPEDLPEEIAATKPDGSDRRAITTVCSTTPCQVDTKPAWSPDGSRLAFRRDVGTTDDGIYLVDADGSNPTLVPGTSGDYAPAWSPDGTKLVVQNAGSTSWVSKVQTIDVDGSDRATVYSSGQSDVAPDWQPAPGPPPAGYARPKGETPLRASLVLAYDPCETPNEQHGTPLAFQSCGPPQAISDFVTVGTADSNALPTKFVGSVKYTTLVGNPATPENEADVRVEASLTDVRCKSAQMTPCSQVALSDYTGELQASAVLRITDKDNDFTRVPATIANDFLPMPVAIPCTATADPTVGATCEVNTTLNAVRPGVVKEGMRAIWGFGEVKVLDGGEDGLAETDDNLVFATQGVFVP